MNFNIPPNTSKQLNSPYFCYYLDDFNKFKAQMGVNPQEKIKKAQNITPIQKFAYNQFYNPNNNQILLQKSISIELTPKKKNLEEISQYIADKNFIKNEEIFQEDQNKNWIAPQQTIQPLKHTLDSFVKPKSEGALKEKLRQSQKQKDKQSHKQKNNENNCQSQMQAQEPNLQHKQEDKLPKRGLTYISKRLSELLRQKKRIKSHELFQIPLFEDEQHNNQVGQNNPSGVRSILGPFEDRISQKQKNQLKDSKQRRNVRRRIYDSINVMVALGIIKKVKNEYIYVEQNDDINQQSALINQEQILIKKKDYLKKLQNDCEYKERCLKYLTEVHSKMKIVRKINSDFQEKINLTNQNTYANTNSFNSNAGAQAKIQFPFLLFVNGNSDIKVHLQAQQSQKKRRKLNDWTDYIEVENPTKQNDLELIRISGEKIHMMSDLDCINLISSIQIGDNEQTFAINQVEILRDYEIINQNRLKKQQEISTKYMNNLNKE